jgi:uncharacterized protein YndB with AHSA1/START domain
MSETTTEHATFRIERVYRAAIERVYAAFSTAEGKRRWFVGPQGWEQLVREHDFRVGGRERVKGRFPNGMVSDFDAIYLDILENRRIIYAYAMAIDDRRISVSLATVELSTVADGTLMAFTEQGVFVNGYEDKGNREMGSGILLDQLGASLAH